MFFNYNSYGDVVVYVDGACRGNGTRRARAGVGVWFDDYHELNLSSSMPGVQTNNNAEIYAAIRAIDILIDYNEYCVEIMTDSMYLCNCMTKWINKWKCNGWKNCRGNTVANKDMIQKLDRLIIRNMNSVIFTHVRGHNNNHGNEQADMLAWQAANELY